MKILCSIIFLRKTSRLPLVEDVSIGELDRYGELNLEGMHDPWQPRRCRGSSADSMGGVAFCRRRGWSEFRKKVGPREHCGTRLPPSWI
ncbi:hypothetical protein IEQ34_018842 [Dendrobium chrysotoxum]|uniref:Uncharacterized protein n=1 Tax=Dendrobium chrysotoxum TaxID=161865 RepID=A0AAV7G725_DENCH|nr:hypothetical protein IEQ34_018842 [Dendrobium chrysotoxum]